MPQRKAGILGACFKNNALRAILHCYLYRYKLALMFDFRLQVFYAVAKRLSFTKAAEELFITQPAVTKHIREIELHFKTALFERNGTKIKLTAAGKTLLQHCETLFALYRTIDFDMHALTEQQSGHLRIGASTTASQYVLPPVLAAFKEKFAGVHLSLTTANTEQVEDALAGNLVDFGIIEGMSKKSGLKYTEFIQDRLVLTCSNNNLLAAKKQVTLAELKKVPLVFREPGSGTLEVIAHALKQLNIQLQHLTIDIQLDSTESIKNYLPHSGSMAFLSIHSITKELQEKQFTIIDVKDLNIQRWLYFIERQGQAAALPQLFMRLARHYNFKL